MAAEDVIKKALEKDIKPLESRLGVHTGFFEELLGDPSDWSFIIKLYALVEVAVAHLLATKLKTDELQDTFFRLDLASEETGQVAFLKALKLLEDYRVFIKALAGIRNDYAHDLSNVSLRFEEYFEKNKKAKERKKMLISAINKVLTSGSHKTEQRVKEAPRLEIWFLGMALLLEIYKDILKHTIPHKDGRNT